MSATSSLPVADLLVHRLGQLGVREVFGYPGGQLTPIYDALYRQSTIRHRLARHEQAAGFMADGYARATGRPGVVLAVCGPGVYNAATPLAASHTDSVPVLLISGQVPLAGKGLRTGYYHENEQLAACTHFTRAQFRAESPAEVIPALDRAWWALTADRPGPVVLEIPVDVLRDSFAGSIPELPGSPRPIAPASGEIAGLARLLASWHRPLILAGGGVVRSGAEAALARLAERLGAPVFHTGDGKCALPGNHPLLVGMPWRRATSDLSHMSEQFSPLLSQGDGLLAVGCRFSQLTTGSWLMPMPGSLAHIDIDREEIGRHYPVQIGLVADARLALEALIEALPNPDRPAWAAIPSRGEPWCLPGLDVLGPLRSVWPTDGILTADVTRLAYIAMAEFALEAPRSFLHPAGAVAMGYALPAALGAKAAFPGRKVVALVGDGGFQMSALELATAVQEELPVVVLLVNDNCLTLIKSTQERRYDNRFIAVHLLNPDFELLARSFGVRYWRAEDEGQLQRALSEALHAETTALIEVRPGDAHTIPR